ncbi:McrC family protein [Facklamia sp. P12955]|uniref:McrC family protein n=1 Tax=Facklamia sp. P12955 TaxID=3421946 RepID=UPI003D1692FC
MPKIISVREYDKIICNSQFENDSRYTYVREDYFDKIIDFIENERVEKDEQILDFFSYNRMKRIGKAITFKNYVGILNINDNVQIEVLPKIDFIPEIINEDEAIKTTKEIFLKMIKSMLDISNKTFYSANLDVANMPIFEIFISLYISEVREIIKKGLKSSYFEIEDNKNVLKGKLLFNKHLKHNLVHKEKFYVGYDEYGINRPENRIIKSTLLMLQKMTSSYNNSKLIRQELIHFEEVEPSYNYQNDFSKVSIDRNTKLYEQAMTWSRIFLYKNSFTTFSGKEKSKAILFPMEKVYEEYVAKEMRKAASKIEWKVKTQEQKFSLFNSLNGEDINKFRLKPDIVLSKGDKQIILDTKWKKLIDNKAKNYGISQADMYQMYAYSKKYNTSEVWLLYPLNKDMLKYKNNIIKYSSNDNVNVSIYFVNLKEIQKDLEKLISLIDKR